MSWSQWMLSNWESKVIRWLISLLITTKPLKIFQFLAKFRFSFYPFSSNICYCFNFFQHFYPIAARLSWKASSRFCSYSSWIIATCFKWFNYLLFSINWPLLVCFYLLIICHTLFLVKCGWWGFIHSHIDIKILMCFCIGVWIFYLGLSTGINTWQSIWNDLWKQLMSCLSTFIN